MEFKCDICGGLLEMDSSGQFARCEFCGMKYPKERLQAKVQEIKGTVKVDGPVSVQGIETKEELLRNAETCLKLQKYDRAEEIFKRVIEKYPEEPQGWWGVFKTGMYSVNYNNPNWEGLIKKDNEYAQTALSLKDYSAEYADIWQTFLNNYGGKVHIDEYSEYLFEEISESDVELILDKENEFVYEKHIKLLKEEIEDDYLENFRKGKVTFLSHEIIRWLFIKLGNDRLLRYIFNETEKKRVKEEYDHCKSLKIIIEEGKKNALIINANNEYMNMSNIEKDIKYFASNYIREDYNKERLEKFERFVGVGGNSCKWNEAIWNIVFCLGNTLIGRTAYYEEGGYEYGFYIFIMKEPFEPQYIREKIRNNIHIAANASVVGEEMNKSCKYCGGQLKKGISGIKCKCCGRKVLLHRN